MKTLEKACKLALDALTFLQKCPETEVSMKAWDSADAAHVMTELRDALEQPAKQIEMSYRPGGLEQPALQNKCDWKRIDDDAMPDTWSSNCGVMWTFVEGGGPVENGMTYCHRCGVELREIGNDL